MMRELFWGATAAAVITAPVWVPAVAHADPDAVPYAVCAELSGNPTIFTVTRVLNEVEASGLTDQQAANIVVDSVTYACPQYISLLQRYADTYAPKKTAQAQPGPRREVIA